MLNIKLQKLFVVIPLLSSTLLFNCSSNKSDVSSDVFASALHSFNSIKNCQIDIICEKNSGDNSLIESKATYKKYNGKEAFIYNDEVDKTKNYFSIKTDDNLYNYIHYNKSCEKEEHLFTDQSQHVESIYYNYYNDGVESLYAGDEYPSKFDFNTFKYVNGVYTRDLYVTNNSNLSITFQNNLIKKIVYTVWNNSERTYSNIKKRNTLNYTYDVIKEELFTDYIKKDFRDISVKYDPIKVEGDKSATFGVQFLDSDMKEVTNPIYNKFICDGYDAKLFDVAYDYINKTITVINKNGLSDFFHCDIFCLGSSAGLAYQFRIPQIDASISNVNCSFSMVNGNLNIVLTCTESGKTVTNIDKITIGEVTLNAMSDYSYDSSIQNLIINNDAMIKNSGTIIIKPIVH